MLEATKLFFNKAADHLDLSPQLRTILSTPKRVVRVELVTESDDGELFGSQQGSHERIYLIEKFA